MTNNTSKENKFVSAVIYLHNDAERITEFLKLINTTLSENFSDYELIFVNDASSDNSISVIRNFYEQTGDKIPMASIIQLSHYQGLESAVNAGRDFAIGDFVFEFDDMLVDYDPSLITDIYQKALTGYDVVSAGCAGASKLSSRLFYGIYNRFNNSGEKLVSETFRILSRRAINQVKSIDRYIPYRKAVYMNCGLESDVINYTSNDPQNRKRTQASRHERSSLAIDSLIYFTNAMGRLAGLMCIAFAVVAVAVGVDIIYETVALTHPVEGWRSTMGFMSVGFFGVFLVLFIIVRYLSVLININFKRSRYLIAGIDKVAQER